MSSTIGVYSDTTADTNSTSNITVSDIIGG